MRLAMRREAEEEEQALDEGRRASMGQIRSKIGVEREKQETELRWDYWLIET